MSTGDTTDFLSSSDVPELGGELLSSRERSDIERSKGESENKLVSLKPFSIRIIIKFNKYESTVLPTISSRVISSMARLKKRGGTDFR